MTTTDSTFRNRLLANLSALARLLGSILLAIAVYFMWPSEWKMPTRLLLSWNIATWLYIALTAWMMAHATEASIRDNAIATDEGRFIVLTLAIAAACASLGAILAQLGAVKEAQGLLKAGHLSLALVTILSAWIFIQLIFTQQYAHEYFLLRDEEKLLPEEARGGLRFPATQQPGYQDFVYFAFVIGCSTATADVETTSTPMRTLVLIHGVISFFFSSAILALTFNIASNFVG